MIDGRSMRAAETTPAASLKVVKLQNRARNGGSGTSTGVIPRLRSREKSS